MAVSLLVLLACAGERNQVPADSVTLNTKGSDMKQQTVPYVYKLLAKEEWKAIRQNEFTAKYGSELDKQDGFIHLSMSTQLERIAHKYFSNIRDGKLLKIQVSPIESILKWEPNSKGELFLHAYGRIPDEAIVKISDFDSQTFDFELLE